jgi:fructose-bisphosphate aldolase class II
MKFSAALFAASIVLGSGADAFTAGVKRSARVSSVSLRETISAELGTPCEDDCAIDKFPNLPASVHPGVVTGQALRDLLEHAKENGYAIPAVNCVSSSGINACLEAARKNDAPIIIQFSSGGAQVSLLQSSRIFR